MAHDAQFAFREGNRISMAAYATWLMNSDSDWLITFSLCGKHIFSAYTYIGL